MTDLPHAISEQYQTQDGYRVVCMCGFEATRTSRDDALADHEGHWNVAQVREQLRMAGRQTGENE